MACSSSTDASSVKECLFPPLSPMLPSQRLRLSDTGSEGEPAFAVGVGNEEDNRHNISRGLNRATSQLCIHCQNMLHNWVPFPDGDTFYMPHWPDETAFRASVQRGCGLCVQLALQPNVLNTLEAILQMERENGVLQVIFLNPGRKGAIDLKIMLHFFTEYYDEDRREVRERYSNFRAFLTPTIRQAALCENMDELSLSSRTALPQVATWFNACRTFHISCTVLANQPLPTRLLFIDTSAVRLRVSEEIQGHPSYATLSHCWGSQTFLTLTKYNITSFQKSIPPEALSQTFRDAIEIVRFVGLRYLWIDSLCIIQDDNDDWAKESSLMTSVYGGSTLNIAASAASDGRVGCFLPRDPSWRFQMQVNIHSERIIYEAEHDMRGSIMDSALAKRGWALQERVLPYRTIHFTEGQVFWECNKNVLCEVFPSFYQRQNLRWPLDGQPVSQDNWYRIVMAYASTSLTKCTDKLVAISGVAQLVQSISGGEYIAGMWRKDLELQLCCPWEGRKIFAIHSTNLVVGLH